MCPLRFILLFFSAVLAGYLAWKTVSQPEFAIPEDSIQEKNSRSEKHKFHLFEMVQNGFWLLIDMASGRYLWRNIKQLDETKEVKSS